MAVVDFSTSKNRRYEKCGGKGMPEYDLVIRGGTVVDGTGIPRVRADLAIKDGRVAMISGRIHGGGAKELDASGCIVAPGAIDLHTHYDAPAQLGPVCLPLPDSSALPRSLSGNAVSGSHQLARRTATSICG